MLCAMADVHRQNLGRGWKVVAGLALASTLAVARPAGAQDACFERLDNGIDLTGWQRSTTNHHGPGTGWTAEEGALVGRQTSGQQGGILMTEKAYRDVEVALEVKIDWGCDSGLFFRTTAGDRAYQVNVDHLMGGGIGTIYGEAFTTELVARDYTLTNQGNTAVAEACHTPTFDLSTWPTLWNPKDWNQLRARIEGNPPHIQVWVANTKVTDFTDSMVRREVDAAGPLALQVHKGDRWAAGGAVRFRNIRVKDLSVPCGDLADGGTGPGSPVDAAAVDSASAAAVNRGTTTCGGGAGCACSTVFSSASSSVFSSAFSWADATALLFLSGGWTVLRLRRCPRHGRSRAWRKGRWATGRER
jgi:hypothetical protein